MQATTKTVRMIMRNLLQDSSRGDTWTDLCKRNNNLRHVSWRVGSNYKQLAAQLRETLFLAGYSNFNTVKATYSKKGCSCYVRVTAQLG